MAFSLTVAQVSAGLKTVTRRTGWAKLKPGELFCAVVKGMGLKKGEKVQRLAILRCVSNTPQVLATMVGNARYGKIEARKEGFPEMSGARFVQFFCGTHNGCDAWSKVNRIEFEYVRFLP
jgi:hypothetical protein